VTQTKSLPDLKATARRFLDTAHAGDVRALDEMTTAGFRLHVPGMPALDRAGNAALLAAYRKAFPDLRNEFHDQVQQGDTVVMRGVTLGTQRGEFNGIPPTQRSVTIAFIDWMRFEGERIAEQHVLFDSLGMLQQLGALPAP
jgi:ketosteroid isomerase-like protein